MDNKDDLLVQKNRKTNNDVLLELEKKNNCDVTSEYMKKWFNRKGNAYFDLMEDFSMCYKNKYHCGKHPDHESLYKVLNAWQEKQNNTSIKIYNKKGEEVREFNQIKELSGFDFLNDMNNEINLLDPLQSTCDPTHQKWHLFVEVFAYSIMMYGEGWKDKLFKKWTCKPLRLWILENSSQCIGGIKEHIEKNEKLGAKTLIDKEFDQFLEG